MSNLAPSHKPPVIPIGPVRVPYVVASGVPTEYADLPDDTLAAYVPGILGRGRILINRRYGLDPAAFQHELEHARQMWGVGLLQRLAIPVSEVLARILGRDPLFESFLEAPAYALQRRAEERQYAEMMARLQERYGRRRQARGGK